MDEYAGRDYFDPERYCEESERSFSQEFGYRDDGDEGYTGEEGDGESW